MLTVGVEEEFLLLGPDGAVRPVATEVVRAVADPRVKPELMTYQVETTSGVCTDLGALESELVDLRRRVAAAAQDAGARLVAAGAPWVGEPSADLVTDDERYRALASAFPDATAGGGTCACHVHVGVADRELAVQVAGRIRPWLPTLLALGTNSPLRDGGDSGWSSTRYAAQLRWPSFLAPRAWASAADYDGAVQDVVRRGAAVDVRSVYFMARPSPRYPTLEVRIADTGLEASDAVLVAGVCRALVTRLVADVRDGRPAQVVTDAALADGLLAVARHGRPLVPGGRAAQDAELEDWSLVVSRLLAAIGPVMDSGEADVVASGLARLTALGTGAERQRRMLRTDADPAALVAAMAAATVSEPTGPRGVLR